MAALSRAHRRRHRRQPQLARRRVDAARQGARPGPVRPTRPTAKRRQRASTAARASGSPTRSGSGRRTATRRAPTSSCRASTCAARAAARSTYDPTARRPRRRLPRGAERAGTCRAVYQFMPRWRVGVAHRTARPGHAATTAPTRACMRRRPTSRRKNSADARLQPERVLARARCSSRATGRGSARPTTSSSLQYQMSLGAHGAHGY